MTSLKKKKSCIIKTTLCTKRNKSSITNCDQLSTTNRSLSNNTNGSTCCKFELGKKLEFWPFL